MSEPEAQPMLQPSSAARDEAGLWSEAPAWRNLTFVAAGLTIAAAALALPPLVEQTPPRPAPQVAILHPPAPPNGTGLGPPAAAPPAGGDAQPHPPVVPPALQERASLQQQPRPAPRPPPPAQAAPAQLASAEPKPASTPQAAPAPLQQACMLAMAPTPNHFGNGVVVGFEDHAASLARIQITQRMTGGLIDPNYVDNQRIVVRLGNGRGHIFLLPKGMTVQPGDRVTFQSGYRNMSLPCNYIPNLITGDLGPAPQSPTSPPPAGGPPDGAQAGSSQGR